MSHEGVVLLDEPFYAPGDQVRGIAVFTIARGTMPRRIELTCSGRDQSTRGLRDLFYCNVVLYDSSLQPLIPTGVPHMIQFELTLPLGLEESYLIETMTYPTAVGMITYGVWLAFIDPIDEHTHLASFGELIEVRRPIRTTNHPVSDEQQLDVVRFCCISGGSVQCRLALDKAHYFPGDTVRFTAELKASKSSLIRGVQVEFGSTIQISDYSVVDNSVKLGQGVQEVDIIETRSVEKLADSIRMTFRVPKEAPSTVVGSTSCRMHYIAVKVNTPSSFYTDFYIVVKVVDPTVPADFAPYEKSLEDRLAAVVTQPVIELAPQRFHLPQSLTAQVQPRIPYHHILVPE